MTVAADRRRSWSVVAAVMGLLVLHVTLALWAVAGKSVTADEILHVTGGYFYNRYGDYRIHPENGNLPQRLAALPAWLTQAPPPPLQDNVYWRTSDASVVAHQFFYETGHDHWPMLRFGRALMMVFSVGTAWLIFTWSRRLFGVVGGLLALGFYVLDPNVLAHAPLATSDSAAVFFLLAASSAFWRYLQQPTWRRGLLSAGVFGLACVAKYSAVLLLPVMGLLLAWRVALETPVTRRRWRSLVPLALGTHAAAAVAVIWLFYGFRYSAFAPDLPAAAHFVAPWDVVLSQIGWQAHFVQLGRDCHLLPEAFLYGYASVIQAAQARGAFLAGEYSLTGWVSFFPLAFLWKTTLPLLAALIAGLAQLQRRWWAEKRSVATDLSAVAPLAVLVAVYGVVSLASHLNIGHRHILPLYPALFIMVGGLAVHARGWRWCLPAFLIGGQAVANFRTAPDYLAFFNSLAGGPANGYRLLVDSSLDWGQDLPGLKDWLDQHNSGPSRSPVYLSYFGSGSPPYYGIHATELPFVNGFKIRHYGYEPGPGLYCISATMLQQVYSPFRGPWTIAMEREYQETRLLKTPLFHEYWHNETTQRELRAAGVSAAFERTWNRYDQLRLARLCHYLRARQPDAVVGHTIFIYRLTDTELEPVIKGPYSAWLAAIERARSN